MSDNRVFNVNGCGSDNLLKTLDLVFLQEDHKAVAWEHDSQRGMVIMWSSTGRNHANRLPGPMDAKQILPLVESYLSGDLADELLFEDWDRDYDHDGSNELGWRVYVEDWGHVGSNQYAICAVRPAYMWYGK